MATTITNECINCGACEPECPNTAIYAGGAPWEINGATSPAIAQDIYYIVPSKCTECVGFYDHEACAAVCPVDCCIPDPANVENEGVLLARARKLHPEETFADDAPSRFRKAAAARRAQASASASGSTGASSSTASPQQSQSSSARAQASARTRSPRLRSSGGTQASSCAGGCAQAAPAAAPSQHLRRHQRRPKPAPAPAAATSAQRAEFDPRTWEVPVICKDCNEPWTIPYRLFAQGVVFHCPSCLGSFVPKTAMYRAVRETFEGFYNRRRAEREAFERKPGRDAAAFEAKQAAEMEEFKQKLQALAHSMKPAGKTVRPKGIAAMFT